MTAALTETLKTIRIHTDPTAHGFDPRRDAFPEYLDSLYHGSAAGKDSRFSVSRPAAYVCVAPRDGVC